MNPTQTSQNGWLFAKAFTVANAQVIRIILQIGDHQSRKPIAEWTERELITWLMGIPLFCFAVDGEAEWVI
jgi:hypothetical protein